MHSYNKNCLDNNKNFPKKENKKIFSHKKYIFLDIFFTLEYLYDIITYIGSGVSTVIVDPIPIKGGNPSINGKYHVLTF